jgi:hypothetical protein
MYVAILVFGVALIVLEVLASRNNRRFAAKAPVAPKIGHNLMNVRSKG